MDINNKVISESDSSLSVEVLTDVTIYDHARKFMEGTESPVANSDTGVSNSEFAEDILDCLSLGDNQVKESKIEEATISSAGVSISRDSLRVKSEPGLSFNQEFSENRVYDHARQFIRGMELDSKNSTAGVTNMDLSNDILNSLSAQGENVTTEGTDVLGDDIIFGS